MPYLTIFISDQLLEKMREVNVRAVNKIPVYQENATDQDMVTAYLVSGLAWVISRVG